MTTNKEWLDDLASNDIPALEAWMQSEHLEGYPAGHERGAASFPQHHEDDSREKLEADVLRYYTHTTSTLMWPEDANIKTKWVSVSMDTVLGWFDRAADIREREFVQQYCAECETAENAALKDDIEVLRNRLDKLQAENDELLAAHADDVERLDAMGEGELQKQVDELQAEVEDVQDELKREWKEAEKWKARCAELQAELEARVRYPDGFVSISDMTERVGRLEAENAELKAELAIANVKLEGKPDCELCDRTNLLTEIEALTAERDSFEHDLNETEAKFAKEMAETLSLHSKQQAASHQAWVDAVDERDKAVEAYDALMAANELISLSVDKESPSNGETNAAKFEIRDFDDSREKLESDIDRWAHSFNIADERHHSTRFYEELRGCMLDVANRQAAITRSEFWTLNLSLEEENGRLKYQADELQTRVDVLNARLKIAHDEANRLKAKLDELMDEPDYHDAWLRMRDRRDALTAERDYWKEQVRKCLAAAVGPGSSTDGVMMYPRGGAYVEPSLLVVDAIACLKDFNADECRRSAELKAKLDGYEDKSGMVSILSGGKLCTGPKALTDRINELQAERDRYRELASELLDAAHNMQLIADRGLA